MPEVFKLLNHKGSDLLDSISGDYEDSFSLDLFVDICHSHWICKKSFLIARVQTVDIKQPEKVFIYLFISLVSCVLYSLTRHVYTELYSHLH